MIEKSRLTQIQLEHLADLLKERIYASLALLAVLVSLDANHISALKAAMIVGGTALSLWAASLVSAQMAYRVVHRAKGTDEFRRRRLIRQHSPLLASAIFPLFVIGLAGTDIFTVQTAITIAIGSIIVALAGWSFAAARAMGASGLATLVLGLIEIGIGLAVVGLKIAIGH